MKKLVLLASAAFIVASMTSCKKDYTCVCTETYSYNGTTQTETYAYTANLKKKDAKTWCEVNSSSSGFGYSTSCALK